MLRRDDRRARARVQMTLREYNKKKGGLGSFKSKTLKGQDMGTAEVGGEV